MDWQHYAKTPCQEIHRRSELLKKLYSTAHNDLFVRLAKVRKDSKVLDIWAGTGDLG